MVERSGRALLGWGIVVAGTVLAVLSAREPVRAQDQRQLERGGLIYQQQCATCHGGGGQGGLVPGTDRRAPTIEGLEIAYVDLVLRTGRMPPPGDPFDNRLRKPVVLGEDREALIAWIDAQIGLVGEIPQAEPGDPARGLQGYSIPCAHCHGSSGGGGVAGAGAFTPPLTGYEPVVIAEAIRVGPFEMPRFSRGQITDEEVDHVVAFLQHVEEEEKTPLFGLVEINPVYASGFAVLLALVTIFSLFWIGGTPAWFPDPRPDPRPGPADKEPDELAPRPAPRKRTPRRRLPRTSRSPPSGCRHPARRTTRWFWVRRSPRRSARSGSRSPW